ncbi:MAG: hypothetical protein GWM92_03455 [Gemmatimonadetes bacterium]|nr:hypothetical protein [Gemmatimonadota bacterium]NIR76947.1 hypothetical protein [Gemmatimonadota bacterium]NIT86117.1 hypothetical protein [Gemmatimonadota bacterium]NIU29934.1 hypothetical protein [Gemmatimonadota bacterium]NIU34909.1 hypothetical protein [Gemmatimonadota bacterium]
MKALLADQDEPAVRDSDVKRRMLELDPSFDEAELGFSKFSRFLAQADEHGVVQVRRRESGNYEVALPGTPLAAEPSEEAPEEDAEARRAREKEAEPAVSPPAPTPGAPGGDRPDRTLGPRRGERHGGRGTRRDGAEGPPPLLEGQVVSSAKSSGAAPSSTGTRAPGPDGGGPTQGPTELGLPTDRNAVIRYLANSYKGVGEKTAEALVDTLGNDLFRVLQTDPDRVREVIPSNRADQLLDAWEDDLRRRRARLKDASGEGRGDGGGDGGGDGPTGGGSGPGGDGRDDDASGDDESEPERSRLGRRGRRTRR